jgi:hypothetical protein
MPELIAEPFSECSRLLRTFMAKLHQYFLLQNSYSALGVYDREPKFSFDVTVCGCPISQNAKVLLPGCLYMKVSPVYVELFDWNCAYAHNQIYKLCGIIISPTKFYIQVLNSEADGKVVDVVIAIFDENIQNYHTLTKSALPLSIENVDNIARDVVHLKQSISHPLFKTPIYHLFNKDRDFTVLDLFWNDEKNGLGVSASIDDLAWPNSDRFSFFS